MRCCMIETSSVPPWKSSATFGYLGQFSENVWKSSLSLRNNFGKSSEIFGKWPEIIGKSSKTSQLVSLWNKQNITCLLVNMNFIFSCSARYLTRVEHSKIKFIYTCGHIISSIFICLHREHFNWNEVQGMCLLGTVHSKLLLLSLIFILKSFFKQNSLLWNWRMIITVIFQLKQLERKSLKKVRASSEFECKLEQS